MSMAELQVRFQSFTQTRKLIRPRHSATFLSSLMPSAHAQQFFDR
jgi:hypothetical protein